GAALALAPLTLAIYPLGPALIIRWYSGPAVRAAFADSATHRLEALPMPVLVAGLLAGFFALALHALIFLNGAFPLFGGLATGQGGIQLTAAAILLLTALTWGLLRGARWAWWGAAACFGLLALSATATLLSLSLADLVAPMRFAPMEVEMLQNLPPAVRGSHFLALLALPLWLTFGLLLLTRKAYGAQATA
ncbi:MAG: hypothetical protein GX605_08330, partial [Chloroflexi bacterium]|nr:hypothetical protein [Chloroflexota bacterium]